MDISDTRSDYHTRRIEYSSKFGILRQQRDKNRKIVEINKRSFHQQTLTLIKIFLPEFSNIRSLFTYRLGFY